MQWGPCLPADALMHAKAANASQCCSLLCASAAAGVVGVQLSDDRRVFSAAELQAAMAEAATQQAAAPAAPAGPMHILHRGQAPPPAAAPRAAVAKPATEPAVVAALPAAAAAPPVAAGPASKVAPWDLDSLLDQLHCAECTAPEADPSDGRGAAAAAAPQQVQQQAQPQPRLGGLLRLPAAVVEEMWAPRDSAAPAPAVPSGRPAVLAVRRPAQPQQQRQQPWGQAGRRRWGVGRACRGATA